MMTKTQEDKIKKDHIALAIEELEEIREVYDQKILETGEELEIGNVMEIAKEVISLATKAGLIEAAIVALKKVREDVISY